MDAKDFLSHDQVIDLIKAVGHKRTVLVMGENGTGKTWLHKTLSADPFFKDFVKPAPIDCTQLSDGSLFMPDIDRERGVSRELPNERMGLSFMNQRGGDSERPVLVGFDEVAKIPQYVKNMIAPIMYDRRIGTFFMPTGSVVFGLTNLAIEGLGDSLAAHLRNRLIVVKMRKSTAQEWINNFAIPVGLNPILIACVEENPQVLDSFVDYLPGGKYAGKDQAKDNPSIYNPQEVQDAYASPRTLHAASDILDAYALGGFDSTTLEQALAGTVGKAFASLLMSFIRFGAQVPRNADVLHDPGFAPVPSNKIAQQIVVFRSIAQTRTRDDAEAYTIYIARLEPEVQSLFLRRVTESKSESMGLYTTVSKFGEMLTDNRLFFKA